MHLLLKLNVYRTERFSNPFLTTKHSTIFDWKFRWQSESSKHHRNQKYILRSHEESPIKGAIYSGTTIHTKRTRKQRLIVIHVTVFTLLREHIHRHAQPRVTKSLTTFEKPFKWKKGPLAPYTMFPTHAFNSIWQYGQAPTLHPHYSTLLKGASMKSVSGIYEKRQSTCIPRKILNSNKQWLALLIVLWCSQSMFTDLMLVCFSQCLCRGVLRACRGGVYHDSIADRLQRLCWWISGSRYFPPPHQAKKK